MEPTREIRHLLVDEKYVDMVLEGITEQTSIFFSLKAKYQIEGDKKKLRGRFFYGSDKSLKSN